MINFNWPKVKFTFLDKVIPYTWAIWLLIIITIPLNIWFGMYYDNPNKLSLKPDNPWYYVKMDRLHMIDMIIKQPLSLTIHTPNTLSKNSEETILTAKASIVYYADQPIYYRGGYITLPTWGKNTKVPSKWNTKGDTPQYTPDSNNYIFPELTDKPVYGFRIDYIVETNYSGEKAEYYTINDKSTMDLFAQPAYDPTTCTNQPDWHLVFIPLSDITPMQLKIDSCAHLAEISLNPLIYEELSQRNLLTKIEDSFSAKFKKTHTSTPDCVFSWTYNVFNNIIQLELKPELDWTAKIENVLEQLDKQLVNGLSLELIYSNRGHHYYLAKVFLVILGWCCLAFMAGLQYPNLTWSRVKSDLSSPYRLLIWLKQKIQLTWFEQQMIKAQKRADKLKAQEAARLKKEQEAEAERIALQRQEEKERAEAERLAKEAAEQKRCLAELKQEVLTYQQQGINEFIQNQSIKKDLLANLENAWQQFCQIQVAELSLADQASLQIIKEFKNALSESEKYLDSLNQQKQAVENMVKKILDLDKIWLSKLDITDKNKLEKIAQQIKGNGFKPRDVKLMDYYVRKIIQDHNLPI